MGGETIFDRAGDHFRAQLPLMVQQSVARFSDTHDYLPAIRGILPQLHERLAFQQLYGSRDGLMPHLLTVGDFGHRQRTVSVQVAERGGLVGGQRVMPAHLANKIADGYPEPLG